MNAGYELEVRDEDVPAIARKLNVANILEGSVCKSGFNADDGQDRPLDLKQFGEL